MRINTMYLENEKNNFQKSGLDNLEEDVYFSVTDVRGDLNAYT
tara:strand:- start:4898 stop:5026 length:129 start_codon:yes stop_codon:yes gene_type:complete